MSNPIYGSSVSTGDGATITSYLKGQHTHIEDFQVTLVQKVTSYRFLGTDYEVYDVHTSVGRYWVIPNILNYYRQEKFPSYDEAFSFHIGTMYRLQEKDYQEPEEASLRGYPSAWTSLNAARELAQKAREPIEYQSAASSCRETLLAFVRDVRKKQTFDEKESADLQDSNFKGWTALFARTIIPINSGRRTYLRKIAAECWDLTVSLLHNPDITVWDLEILLSSVDHVLDAFAYGFVKFNRGPVETCPNCGSHRYVGVSEIMEKEGQRGLQTKKVCSACDHVELGEFDPF